RPVGGGGGHVGGAHLQDLYVVLAHAPLLQGPANQEPLVRIAVGDGNRFPPQVLHAENSGILVDHQRRTVPVPQVNDLDWHPLLTQRHGEGRQDEGRLHVARQVRLFQLGEAVEPNGFNDPVPTQVLIDEVGDGTG